MSSTAFILVFLICGLVPKANSIKCLSCTAVLRPRDCQYVQECGPHEKCSIISYITALGDLRYDVGCVDGFNCDPAGRKRDVLSTIVINEIQQKKDFGAVPEEQSDQNNLIVCSECCDAEICNIKGCGEEGFPPNIGLLCYACEQEHAPDKCNKITLCSRDSSCHLSTVLVGMDMLYKSDCLATERCNQMGFLDVGANQLVGRRDVDMISRSQRGAICNKCCSKNLCNSDNCTSVTTVNGAWSTWSHWNLCSVTCGGGHQYRVRVCQTPHPSGAPCSGSNKETVTCNDQQCAGVGQVDGQWGSWMLWSSCSETCGSDGTGSRQRNCDSPRPSATGLYCIGQASETRHCSVPYGPPTLKGGHTYSSAAGSQVIIGCVDHDSGSPQHIRQIRWTVPQLYGQPSPTNLEQYADGSLVIHGLKAENCGHYSCTVDTDCGSYNSPDYFVTTV